MVQDLGVDVIVTDHHEIGRTLPEAYAIVHPMHPEFSYPFQYLCGAGVQTCTSFNKSSTSTISSASSYRDYCRLSIPH